MPGRPHPSRLAPGYCSGFVGNEAIFSVRSWRCQQPCLALGGAARVMGLGGLVNIVDCDGAVEAGCVAHDGPAIHIATMR